MCLEITQPYGLVGERSTQYCGKIDLNNDFNEDCRSTELVGKNVAETASLNLSRKQGLV